MLIANLAVSCALVGLIWVIQFVHYPLFEQVTVDNWSNYHARHTQQITLIVAPLMLAELLIVGLLLAGRPGDPWIWASAGIVAAMWLSTFFIQVPLHNALSQGWDASLIQRLTHTNWLRTAGWSMKAGIAVWMVYRGA